MIPESSLKSIFRNIIHGHAKELINPIILAVYLGVNYWLFDWIGLAFGFLIWTIVMICTGRFEKSKFQQLSKGLTESEIHELAFMIIEEKRQDEFFNSPPKGFRFSKAQFPELLLPVCLIVWLGIAGLVNGQHEAGAFIGLISYFAIGSKLLPTLSREIYVPSKEKVFFIITFYALCTGVGFYFDGFGGVFISIIIFWLISAYACAYFKAR